MIIWKSIDYKGVELLVSNTGVIKIPTRYVTYSDGRQYVYKEHIVKTYIDKGGYEIGTIKIKQKTINLKVHRLVAKAFIPNPDNLPQVNHKDENKTNNTVWINDDGSINYDKTNLEWCTNDYNHKYGTIRSRISKSNTGNPKICKPVLQFDLDGSFIKEWSSLSEINRELGYDHSCISSCCSGYRNRKKAYGYVWKYKIVA